jgi:peptidoglycan hydrolase-like protein with peptidoglycan-binding domain
LPSARNKPASKVLAKLGWSRRDVVAVAICAGVTIAILINVLLMQAGQHPAPMFKGKHAATKPTATVTSVASASTASVPRPRPAEAAPVTPVTATPLAPVPVRTVPVSVSAPSPAHATPPAHAKPAAPVTPPAAVRTPGAIITDIQRELARRGFFDNSAVDGYYGPKTDRAIREFERAARLKPSRQPSDALLQAIQNAPARVAKAGSAAATVRPPAARNDVASARPAPVQNDVAARRPAPSRRVVALQRVLAEFGYGQIKPTGIIDADTQAAIERFERERKLPVTGQANDRVARELAAVTGRTVD